MHHYDAAVRVFYDFLKFSKVVRVEARWASLYSVSDNPPPHLFIFYTGSNPLYIRLSGNALISLNSD